MKKDKKTTDRVLKEIFNSVSEKLTPKDHLLAHPKLQTPPPSEKEAAQKAPIRKVILTVEPRMSWKETVPFIPFLLLGVFLFVWFLNSVAQTGLRERVEQNKAAYQSRMKSERATLMKQIQALKRDMFSLRTSFEPRLRYYEQRNAQTARWFNIIKEENLAKDALIEDLQRKK
mgnify:FL=1